MYQLKGIKTYPRLSEETNAFTASLYKNDKKIADCKDSGTGGCIDIYFKDSKEESSFYAFIKTLPPVDYQGIPLDNSADIFLGEFVDKHLQTKENEKQIKYFAKKGLNTVVYAENKKKREIFYLGMKNLSELEASEAKYPDHTLTVIHNKELSPSQILEETHKRNISQMLKKKNIKVVVYLESPDNTGYIGLSHLNQLEQVNAKYPLAKVSVIHQ